MVLKTDFISAKVAEKSTYIQNQQLLIELKYSK